MELVYISFSRDRESEFLVDFAGRDGRVSRHPYATSGGLDTDGKEFTQPRTIPS